VENVSYIALSRQLTLRRELDIAANNIANADTAGFKVEQLLLGTETVSKARNFGVSGPGQFVLDNGVGRDFSAGTMNETGRPFDVAIDGDAFFKVGGPQGERYTRDGRFGVDALGKLVNGQGLPVLDEGGGEIVLDPKKPEPTIAADGIVSQGIERVGKIGLVRFATLAALSKDGDNLYVNASNAQALPAPDAKLNQGMLEGSNVKSILEITNLIEISRAYERVSKIIEQNNELSQRTVERLGRVS
jgi:flagellar basal-body rod protein FlgF